MLAAVADWPLVGRRGEIAQIESILGRSDRSGVVLAGPAGVGKTRLAAECLSTARHLGFASARAAATRSASSIPFGALAPLLPVEHPAEPQAVYLRRAAEAVGGIGAGAPVMLVVDDAHLLDDASAVLVHQIAQAQRAFVVGTLRSGEPVPEPVLALWKDGVAERIELSTLDEADVVQLLDHILDGDVDTAIASALWAATGGNALYLRELFASAIESGAIAKDGDAWRLAAPLKASTRITELVTSRLEDLDGDERELLELVAFGDTVGIGTIEQLGHEERLERLERRGLIDLAVEGRRRSVRLAHPLYGEVVRASTPTLRARRAQQSLADALESHGAQRREDVLRVATWRLEGGGPADARLMLKAARRARSLADLRLAVRLAHAARDAGAGMKAGLLAAECLMFAGRAEEAESEFASMVSEVTDDGLRALFALMRFENQYYGLSDYDAASANLEEAKRTITDPDQLDVLRAGEAIALTHRGAIDEALKLVEPVLERANGGAFVTAVSTASWVFASTGQVQRALDLIDRAEAVAGFAGPMAWPSSEKVAGDKPSPQELWHRVVIATARCQTLAWAGHLKDARDIALEHQRVLGRSIEGTGWVAWTLAEILLLTGELDDARRAAQRATDGMRSFNRPVPLLMVLVTAAVISGQLGDVDGAQAQLDEIDGLAPGRLPVFSSTMDRARAWAACARGELGRARELFLEAANGARAHSLSTYEMSALHDLARVGGARDVADRLTALASEVEGPRVQAAAAHAAALALDDGDALTAVGRTFEDIGAILFAAEAATAAAAAHVRRGEARKAREAELRAADLASRTQGARTPGLMPVSAQSKLTPREREVATLAAAGTTNNEIAQRLALSVRTVHNQLQRVYEKLGIHGRTELSERLGSSDEAVSRSGWSEATPC